MKKLVLVTCALFSVSAFADITKEVWTCKGKDGVVSELKATVNNVDGTVDGNLFDGTMSGTPISLEQGNDVYHLNGYIAPGHDDRTYAVQLIQSRRDDFDYGYETVLKGQAVVVYNGFIDCIGDVAGAEVLNCEVKVDRQK